MIRHTVRSLIDYRVFSCPNIRNSIIEVELTVIESLAFQQYRIIIQAIRAAQYDRTIPFFPVHAFHLVDQILAQLSILQPMWNEFRISYGKEICDMMLPLIRATLEQVVDTPLGYTAYKAAETDVARIHNSITAIRDGYV